jgi:hypothetical protein
MINESIIDVEQLGWNQNGQPWPNVMHGLESMAWPKGPTPSGLTSSRMDLDGSYHKCVC